MRQLAEEMNATADKRWREGIERQMTKFEEMIRGLVDAQVRGAQVRASDLESSGVREREELGGEQQSGMRLPQVEVRQENRSAGEQVNELRGRINYLNQEREREELRDPHRANELEQRMMQFQKTLEALKAKTEGKKVVGRLLLDDESPLIREVMAVTLPPKYVVPALVYEGKNDPNDHVEKFNEMTEIQGLMIFKSAVFFL